MTERSPFPGFESFADARAVIVRLAERRQELGLTQADVAARMRTSQPAVARLESLNGDARLSTLARYAEALGTTIGFALGGRDEGP